MPAEQPKHDRVPDLAQKEVDERESEQVKGGIQAPMPTTPPVKRAPAPATIIPCI